MAGQPTAFTVFGGLPPSRSSEIVTLHYPAVATVLEAASLRPLLEYVLRRRRYLQNWVQNRTSYQQCVQMTQGVGGPQRHYWWSNTDQ